MNTATNKRDKNKCKDCGKFHGPNECGKERRKRFNPPCNYCVSKGIPEPKRSSHKEEECRFKSGQYTWREPKPAQTQAPPQAAVTTHQGRNSSNQQGGQSSSHQGAPQQTKEQRENAVRSHFLPYLQNKLPDEMSVGSSSATRLEARISCSAVRHNAQERREEQIEELRAQSEDDDDGQSRFEMIDPNTVMVMSSSDEDEDDTDEEEEEDSPPYMPDLSDTDNTDNSDDEGANDSPYSGRSSPDQPDEYRGSEDDENDQDPNEKGRYNDEHKNVLPGLVTPGDSGIENQSDSDFDDELGEENPNKEDNHFKGTAFFEEYFDKSRNAPGSTKVEDHELKCPMLSTVKSRN